MDHDRGRADTNRPAPHLRDCTVHLGELVAPVHKGRTLVATRYYGPMVANPSTFNLKLEFIMIIISPS